MKKIDELPGQDVAEVAKSTNVSGRKLVFFIYDTEQERKELFDDIDSAHKAKRGYDNMIIGHEWQPLRKS